MAPPASYDSPGRPERWWRRGVEAAGGRRQLPAAGESLVAAHAAAQPPPSLPEHSAAAAPWVARFGSLPDGLAEAVGSGLSPQGAAASSCPWCCSAQGSECYKVRRDLSVARLSCGALVCVLLQGRAI